MRIEFTKDELYENEGRNRGHQFHAGEQYDFTPVFAQRWLRRELAKKVEGDFDDPATDVFEPVKTVDPVRSAAATAAAKAKADRDAAKAAEKAEREAAKAAAAEERERQRLLTAAEASFQVADQQAAEKQD